MADPVKLRSLRGRDRDAACALLERRSRENLYLLDLVAQQGGAPQPGEPRAECLGAWRGDELASVLSLRPSIAFAADADAAVIAALVPYADLPGGGLVKSDVRAVARLWSGLAARGRRGRRTSTSSWRRRARASWRSTGPTPSRAIPRASCAG